MKIFEFFRQKIFWKHISFAVMCAIVVTWLVFLSLKLFTQHGITQTVPDFTGLTVPEAIKTAKTYGLELVISDSTFVGGRMKGTIVSHIPTTDEKVKKGRRIFAIINAHTQPSVPMPNVTGVSYRQAKVSLESSGLKVGKLIYVPDPMKDYVIKQRYKGLDIKHGDMVPKGDVIDLIVGKGLSGQTSKVIELIGATLSDASDALSNVSLNVGLLLYDETIQNYADTINARIYEQLPPSGTFVNLGTEINLWLTIDKNKVKNQ